MKKIIFDEFVSYGNVAYKNPFTGDMEIAEEIVFTGDKVEKWVDDKTCKTRKKVKKTHATAILSGSVCEIKRYTLPLYYNFDSKANGKSHTSNEKRNNNLNSSKVKLRRLINSNVDYTNSYNNKFLTFTYESSIDGLDIKKVKDDWKKFVKRLKYKLKIKDLKWVYVCEIQHERMEKYGDRVWHIHAIFFNLPYVDVNLLRDIWGFGFVRINCIDNVDNVGSYVVKYMEKDSEEIELNTDLYGRSRGNLQEPTIVKEEEVVDVLESSFEPCQLAFESEYGAEYYEKVIYRQFNYLRKSIKK